MDEHRHPDLDAQFLEPKDRREILTVDAGSALNPAGCSWKNVETFYTEEGHNDSPWNHIGVRNDCEGSEFLVTPAVRISAPKVAFAPSLDPGQMTVDLRFWRESAFPE
jgi:hypothetical protein